MRIDPDQLASLSAILRTGSFDAAAEALNVTPSAVSQRLKALENRLGTVLVLRSSPCQPTQTGQRVARHADAVALLETQLAQDLGVDASPAQVRIAVNADSLATWFPTALARVQAHGGHGRDGHGRDGHGQGGDGTGMLFALEADDQEFSAEWLRKGAVAAAVTARADPVRGCDSLALGALPYIATASPTFFDRWFAQGVTDAALARAPMMTFNAKDQLQSKWLAARTGRKLAPPSHVVPSSHAFVEAALAGLGWGLNPAPLVQSHLAAGRLIALDPRSFDTPLYWQIARHLAVPLRPLTQAVLRTARQCLHHAGTDPSPLPTGPKG